MLNYEAMNGPNPQLHQRLAEYRRVKAESPSFYHNEIAERARAINRIRPTLENFLAERISLLVFKQEIASFSRTERASARGRSEGRYWRFNASGTLFLESVYKQAEALGRLNGLAQVLRAALVAPETLSEVNYHITSLETVLTGLNSLAREHDPSLPKITLSFIPYFLSYFWAIQNPRWAVYDRQTRQEMQNLGFLTTKESQNLIDGYSNFFLALNKLSRELELTNSNERESFLHWLAYRQAVGQPLLKQGKPSTPTAKKKRTHALEELRQILESCLQDEVAAGLHGTISGDESLSFREIQRSIRLELRLNTATGAVQVGAACDGLSPAALLETPGNHFFVELQGFLESRPEYAFYANPSNQPETPSLHSLAGEFWLLRPAQAKPLPEDLLAEWRILYPFMRKLTAPFDETFQNFIRQNDWGIPSSDMPPPEPLDTPFAYEQTDFGGRAVAESFAEYTAEEENFAMLAPDLDPLRQMEQEERRRADEIKILRLAQYSPPPLTADQAEGIIAFVQDRLLISEEKITQVLTHLESGRNIILHGSPGSGKTRLARLIAGQLCAAEPGWASEKETRNYTLSVATAEWSLYDVIGGLRPGLPADIEEMSAQPLDTQSDSPKPPTASTIQYFYELGVVSRAALACETSLAQTGRPHYLIIDEFNRANQDRAFGQLFTLLEYRDQPLLPGERLGRVAELYLPNAFRIIGTMNSDDRNNLFEVGMALRRRFSLIEIPLPDPQMEQKFLPKAVKARLPEIKLTASGEFEKPNLQNALRILTAFAAAVRPKPNTPDSKGKPLGTAFLIECLVFCAVADRFYPNPADALEDAIIADILPQLERSPLAVAHTLQMMEQTGEPLSALVRVKAALEKIKQRY
jgi:AAA domain (dynein-related subfamily)